jgi:hypothetical protein
MKIKLAMAFNKDYIVLGSGKEQVKQLGNAVTPPVYGMACSTNNSITFLNQTICQENLKKTISI